MTTLSIGRLSATVHAGPDDEVAGPRVSAMLEHLAERRLDEALRAAALPPGEWYVRRLDLVLQVDEDRPGSAVEARWAAALLDALRRALAVGSPDVVHHPHPVAGLAELIGQLAAGRTGNAWAWRRAGLLRPGDPAPESAPAEVVLAVAHRRPELVSAALVAAVRAVGLPALHRLLGARGWRRLATIVRASAGGPAAVPPAAVLPSVEGRAAAGDRTVRVGTIGPAAVPDGAGAPPSREAAADVVGPARSPAHRALVAALLTRSVLATEFRRGMIRPDPELALAWAVLAVAEADPGLLARSGADGVLRHLAAVLAGTATAAPPAAGPPAAGPTAAAGPPARVPPATPEPGDRAVVRAEQPAPDEAGGAVEPGDEGAPTGWAGLLFLLATAEEAGVPQELLDDPVLARRPLRWVVTALVPRLLRASSAGPTADDPAVLAFAGLVPTARPPEGRPPLQAEADSLDVHAGRWAATTAQRLGRDDEDPGEVVLGIARRRGVVVAVPGWIELHLPLSEVDVDIRRAGLDLDPGWVPWLGAVVRYVYA
jgi:hypothetical protein